MQLIINSKFRPFTYDELIKPMLQYKEVYDKVENDYSTLAAQTEQWKDIANQTQSPEAYEMYSNYSRDLNNVVDSFSRGMTIQNRSQLLNMRRRYASDIRPIEVAANRRKELADEQRKMSLQDPTRIWEKKATDMSLDELIHNPSADYGNSVSGANLTAQVAAKASALAKEFRNNPNKMISLVGGDYYEYVKQRGFSSKAVLEAVMNSPNASPILTNLVESTIDASGIKSWGSDAAKAQAYNYAKQGLWNAVGQDEAQIVNNWRAQQEAATAAKKKEDEPKLDYKPRTFNHLEASGNLKGMQNIMNKITRGGKPLAKYFGDKGDVNPMKVYEEWHKLASTEAIGNMGSPSALGVRVNADTDKTASEKIQSKYRRNYAKGIQIISSEEYNLLKDLGYSSNSNIRDFYGIGRRLNEKATEYTENFVNGANIDYLSKVLNTNISTMAKNEKTFANIAVLLDKNFRATSKTIDPDDYGTKENPIVDLSHTTKYPNKLILSYQNGDKVLINPDLVSGEARNIMLEYQNQKNEYIKQGYNKQQVEDYLEPYLMQKLVKLSLRGYNPNAPTTDSKLD